jgi:hypothetical protein
MNTPTNNKKTAPFTDERVEAITKRLADLPKDDQSAVIWRLIGNMQYRAVDRPNAPAREFFELMEKNVAAAEAKNAGLLNAEQLNGCACVTCGDNHRPMIPLGIETKLSTELFACNRSECTVDPDVIRNRIPVSARVAA